MTSRNVFFAKTSLALTIALAAAQGAAAMDGAAGKSADRIETGKGPLEIVFLGHASLVMEFQGKRIYIDPVSRYADFSKYPKADLILITHEHGDHLEGAAVAALKGPSTRIIASAAVRSKLGEGEALECWQKTEAAGIAVEAVPAYNTTEGRSNFHPKERKDNGYILTFGDVRLYAAGDTEPIPEMANLGRIDIAFLPMNQPYTMTPEQAAAAAKTIRPKILYPYHFGTTDTGALAKLLAGETGIELRIRDLQ
jgi:L-ascorbate metabolism protein UlaG (beta-lactamase superfamily)